MTLDYTLSREIKKEANGDGSREAKFAFLAEASKAKQELSSPSVIDNFGEILQKYGRVKIAMCVAATITARADRLNRSTVDWAKAVLRLWANRPTDLGRLYIDDGLHPSKIEIYAGGLIRATTEEAW